MTVTPAQAYIGPKGAPEEKCFKVHFNPTSLKISLTNQFGEDPPEQHAKPTATKLDVELIFDTTEFGEDVRTDTAKLRVLATATGTSAAGGKKKGKKDAKEEANHSLILVAFHWGTTEYVGLIESLTETLDYWSSDGVPLRSSIQLSMKGAAEGALTHQLKAAGAYAEEQSIPELQDVTPAVIPPDGTGTTGAATEGGDPQAGRMLAANNGLENMRAPMGGTLGAAAGVQLSAAASFEMSGGISAGAAIGFGAEASAGASLSAGLGASVGIGMAAGAGIGLGASAGAGFGLGASAGAGFGLGASASAGFGLGASASAGFGVDAAFGASASAAFGIGGSAGASFGAGTAFGAGASASAGFGMGAGAAGGGIGIGASMTTSVTGFDGVTHTETHSSFISPSGSFSTHQISSGSASAGVAASQGAFAWLGKSKTMTAAPGFDPDRFLGPPAAAVGPYAQFSSSGRLVTSNGQVAASYTARESVVVF